MKSKEWLELINKNEDKIIEIGMKAYADATNNKHLRFIVEIDEDGDVGYWHDIAGGNSYHMSVHNGTSMELFQFCFQYSELEITEDDIIDKLIEKGYENRIEELKEEAEEENTSIEVILINNHNNDELINVIEECQKEAVEFDISEYARDMTEQELDCIKKMLEECCDW